MTYKTLPWVAFMSFFLTHAKCAELATAVADGSPALVPIILSLTRPTAGLFDKDKLVTTSLGGSTYFIPCSHQGPCEEDCPCERQHEW